MIKLKLSNQLPEQAALLGFVKSPHLSIDEHFNLADFSDQTQENIAGIQDTVIQVELNTDPNKSNISDTDVIIGNRSVLDIQSTTPKYLFYKHEIGRNLGLVNSNQFWVFLETDRPDTELGRKQARFEIKRFLKILDKTGEPVNNINWDIEVVGKPSPKTYLVDLYLSTEGDQNTYFQVHYNAIDSLGIVRNGFTEFINPRPYLIRRNRFEFVGDILTTAIDTKTPSPDTDYSLDISLTNFTTSIRLGSTVLDNQDLTKSQWSDAIGLFYIGTDIGKYIIDTSNIYLFDPDILPTNTVKISYINKSIKVLVEEINSLGLEYRAIPMNDQSLLETNDLGVGSFSINENSWVTPPAGQNSLFNIVNRFGVSIKQRNHLNVLFPSFARIFVKKPFRRSSPIDDWYIRINDGLFKTESNIYFIPELKKQSLLLQTQAPWASSPITHYRDGEEAKFKDFLDEEVTIIDTNLIQTQHPFVPMESVHLFAGTQEITNKIIDYNIVAGVFKVSDSLAGFNNLRINYSSQIIDYIYTGIDLNPTDIHNPDIHNKFIGFYILPAALDQLNNSVSIKDRVVFHVVRDSIQDIVNDVRSLTDSSGIPSGAVLLAVANISENFSLDQIEFTDLRIHGGGIKQQFINEQLSGPTDINFFADIGRYDGLPYPTNGSYIVRYPKRITIEPVSFPVNEFDMLPIPLQRNEDDPTLDVLKYALADGRFTIEDIKSKIIKYGPVGSLPFIEPYEPN